MYLSFNHKQKNVLTTISDKKFPIDNNGLIDHYVADITSVSDSAKCYFETYIYKVQNLHWLIPTLKSLEFLENELLRIHNRYYYPFGNQIDGRTFGSEKYRFGFQGQEAENEISGIGNYSFFKYRISDNRLGRFFAVDPLVSKYPMYSSYSFAANQPIHSNELEGLENPNDLNATVKANLSVSLSEKGFNFRLGATLGLTKRLEPNFQVDFSLSGNIYNRGIGTTSEGGFWGNGGADASASLAVTSGFGENEKYLPMYLGPILSPSASSNNFDYSGTYGQSIIFSTGTGNFQRNGIIGARFGDFSFYSHNDTKSYYGGGGTDEGYTGGIRMTISLGNEKTIEALTEVYTGVPSVYVRQKGTGKYNPKMGLRIYPQGADKNLNNGFTSIMYNDGSRAFGIYSQGKGNLFLQRAIHTYFSNNWVFDERETSSTEFGTTLNLGD